MHKETKSWQLRCTTLATDLKNNLEKFHLAVHLSQEDRSTISILNRQLQDAWNTVAEVQGRENAARTTVAELQDEIQMLSQLVEQGMSIEVLHDLEEKTSKKVYEFKHQIDALKDDINLLNLSHNNTIEKAEKKQEEIEALKQERDNLYRRAADDARKLDDANSSIQQLENRNRRLSKEGKESKLEIEVLKQRVKRSDDTSSGINKDLENLMKQLREEKTLTIRQKRELEEARLKIDMSNNAILMKEETLKKTIQEKQLVDAELRLKNKELREKELHVKKATDQQAGLARRLAVSQRKLNTCTNSLVTERTESKHLESRVFDMQKMLNSVNTKLSNTLNELASTDRKLRSTQMKNSEIESVMTASIGLEARLQTDMHKSHMELQCAIRVVDEFVPEYERKRLQCIRLEEEIKCLNKKLNTSEYKLQAQEITISQLEFSAKKAEELSVKCHGERDKIEMKLQNIQVKQTDLTLANTALEKHITVLKQNVRNEEDRNEHLQNELQRCRSELNTSINERLLDQERLDIIRKEKTSVEQRLIYSETVVRQHKQHINDLNANIQHAITQRNIIGVSLIKEKEKGNMLLDKNTILTTILKAGSKMYDARMREMKSLNVKNLNIYRQKDSVMRQLECIKDLRSKLGLVNKQLVTCQARCKALEDRPPISVHKWRYLEQKDASLFEIVLKNTHLTRRLIEKTDEIARLESLLIEKATVVDNMKDTLSRNHGVSVKVTEDRKLKEEMSRKLKACLAEKNMAEWNAKQKEEEAKKLRKDLDEERKKRIQLQRKGGDKKAVVEDQQRYGFLPPLK